MIDHITYMMSPSDLESEEMKEFFRLLDMFEEEPDPVIEKDWKVRWFRPSTENSPLVHLVAGPRTPELELAHFCVTFDDYNHSSAVQFFEQARHSKWLERDSGSGRIWLKGPGGIRVEVRAHRGSNAQAATGRDRAMSRPIDRVKAASQRIAAKQPRIAEALVARVLDRARFRAEAPEMVELADEAEHLAWILDGKE